MHQKTIVKVMVQSGPPQVAQSQPVTREEKVNALLRKIEYAADCIEYDHCKPQAIEFLQKLHRDLNYHKRMTDDIQMLMQKCWILIRDYGTLPVMPEKPQDSKED